MTKGPTVETSNTSLVEIPQGVVVTKVQVIRYGRKIELSKQQVDGDAVDDKREDGNISFRHTL